MNLNLIIELAVLAILIVQCIIILLLFARSKGQSQEPITRKLAEYDQRLDKNEAALRDEFGRSRDAADRSALASRQELSASLQGVSGDISNRITAFEERVAYTIANLSELLNRELQSLQDSVTIATKENREELAGSLNAFEEKSSAKIEGLTKDTKDSLEKNRETVEKKLADIQGQVTASISSFSELLNKELQSVQDRVAVGTRESREELTGSLNAFEEKFSTKIEGLTKDTKEGLEKNRETVEKKLADIQKENTEKLEQMRETVDEKLHKTLETRLGESFKLVSERLELVQKGLGEMQNLASDVGDLKKVMSNVKTKGVLGEYQLGAILEEILQRNQYETNVKTKAGSDRNVEFAIKIPSKEDASKPIWLPIDSKLPTAGYETLIDAYNSGDKKLVEDARKTFAKTVKNFAKDIHDKYIDPPNTTDFAIMFLPFEGIYAEIMRDPELFESIQREYKINITGPSTMAALLSALRVGFNSLAVDKNTGEIKNLLSSVKKEFTTFETVLAKVKKQIDTASTTLEQDVSRRTKAINKALKKVETLPDDSTGQKVLADDPFDREESEE